MRNLKKNQQTIYFSLLLEESVPILDEEGYETGEYEDKYTEPQEMSISISTNKGKGTYQKYGIDETYDREMTTFELTENVLEVGTRLYVDVVKKNKNELPDGARS